MYMDSLNPKLDRLFQRAQRKAKWFNLHDFSITCLFENAPIGKNTIENMTKLICKAAGEPQNWTNHCLRATGISTLKKLGFEDRAICNVTRKFFFFFEYKITVSTPSAHPVPVNVGKGWTATE